MSDAEKLPWIVGAQGLILSVRLTPRGGRDAIDGTERRADGQVVVKARVRAAASDGEANAALCRLFAGALGIASRDVTIVAGATSRVKRVHVAGETTAIAATLRRLLTTD